MAEPRRTAPSRAAPAPARPAPRTAGRAQAAPAASPRGSRRQSGPPAAPVKANYTGEEGMRRMREVEKEGEARREANKTMMMQPHRYFVKPGEIGELIIVDDSPNFFRQEHALFNKASGRYDLFVPCIDAHAICPACSVDTKPSYYAMYLTVIDLTGYENKNTGEWVEFSKKLLVIKPMQQKKFIRLYDQHKTLRGMVLEMARDRKEDAAIGDPTFIEFTDEEELLGYEYSYFDRDDKEHLVDCSEPYDYEAIFPDPTEESLTTIVGGRPAPGSARDDNRTLGRTASRRGAAPAGDEWDNQEAPARGARPGQRARSQAAPERAAPVRSARRGAPVEDQPDDDAPDGDLPWNADDAPDAGQDIPVSRGSRTGRTSAAAPAAPARRPARGAAREAPETVEYEDVQDDAPPARPARTARAAAPAARPAARLPAPAPTRAARTARPAPEPDPEGDDDGYDEADRTPPARNASSVAARRATLRR